MTRKTTPRKPMRRRTRWLLGVSAVALIGGGLGFFVVLPAMVERAGLSAVERLETRLGIEIRAESVDWDYDGNLDASGVVVAAADADSGAPPLFVARRVRVKSNLSIWSRRVELLEIDVDDAVVHILRGSDGAYPARRVVDRLAARMARESPAGPPEEASSGLVKSMPIVRFSELQIVADRPSLPLPDGLEIPERVRFEGGSITVTPDRVKTGSATGSGAVRIAGGFRETSLDPGNPVSMAVVIGADRRIERPELGFERPVRFYLGRRVVGVRGIRVTDDGAVLSGLQLSVPLGEGGGQGGNAQIGAAATIDTVEIRPSPWVLAGRVAAGEATGVDLRAILKNVDSVKLGHPVVMTAINADGRHSFEDLMGPLRLTRGIGARTTGARGRGPSTLAMLSDAALDATVLLTQDSAKREAQVPLRDRLAGIGRRTDAWVERGVGRLRGLLQDYMGPEIAVTNGELHIYTGEDRWETQDVSMSVVRGDLGVTAKFAALLPKVTGQRASVEVSVQAGSLRALVDAPGLPLDRLAGVLPSFVTPKPESVLEALRLELTHRTAVEGDKGGAWRVSGRVAGSKMVLSHEDLAAAPLLAIDASADFTVMSKTPGQAIELAPSKLTVGDVSFTAAATLSGYDRAPRLSVSLDLPTTAVQAIVDAMPRALIPKLDGLTVRGTLAWPLRITLDSVDIDGIEIVSKPVLSGFRVVTMGKSIDFDRLKSAFKYTIRGVDGEPARRRSGPLTGRFAALEDITPYMAKAVTTTEDGSFYTHDGISTFAIRESIITNLRQGKFSRGASTLTQQLVKNLYLGPDKTVSRKLQELFIARQIEEALSKEELIALYLNIIEWGPGIYGIVEASEHYFGKAPAELTALQAIFLSSIIPNPRRYHGFFDAGQVSPRWRNYLRVLLGVMVQRNKISLAEQEAAFPYDPVFRGQERVSPTPVPQDVPPHDYQPPPLDEAPQ